MLFIGNAVGSSDSDFVENREPRRDYTPTPENNRDEDIVQAFSKYFMQHNLLDQVQLLAPQQRTDFRKSCFMRL